MLNGVVDEIHARQVACVNVLVKKHAIVVLLGDVCVTPLVPVERDVQEGGPQCDGDHHQQSGGRILENPGVLLHASIIFDRALGYKM